MLRESLSALLDKHELRNAFITYQLDILKHAIRQSSEKVDLAKETHNIESQWRSAKELIVKYQGLYFEDEHIDIFYSGKNGSDACLVRIAPDYFVDYLTDTKALRSYFGQGVRVDIVVDARGAADMKKDLEFYQKHPHFYENGLCPQFG